MVLLGREFPAWETPQQGLYVRLEEFEEEGFGIDWAMGNDDSTKISTSTIWISLTTGGPVVEGDNHPVEEEAK